MPCFGSGDHGSAHVEAASSLGAGRQPPGLVSLVCASHRRSIFDNRGMVLREEGWHDRGCQRPGMARPRRG
jgi:hypothetical protein